MCNEGYTSTSHHGMWRISTTMGIDYTTRGIYVNYGNKVGPGIMIIPATIQTLYPATPPCSVVGADAVCGV